MGGFNPAWFIAVAVGVVLTVITASSLSGGWALTLWVVAGVSFLIGIVGLTVDFHRNYMLRLPFVPRQGEETQYKIEPLTFHDLLQSYLHDRSIYISDLARTDSVIRDKVFENVTFIGPAIITFGKNTVLTGSRFAGVESQESVLLEVPEGTLTVGAIAFENCVFRSCHFLRIQVMGLKPLIDRLRENFTGPKEPRK